MSLYSYDQHAKPDNVPTDAMGTPLCGQSHWNDGWYMRDRPRPFATTAWAIITGYWQDQPGRAATKVVFACKKHAAIIKAQQSKGSYGWSDALLLDATPAEVLADMPGILAKVTERVRREYKESRATAAANDLRYRREGWDKAHAEYAQYADLRSDIITLSDPDDYFGLVTISIRERRFTPNEAREVGRRLQEAAAMAEALTAQQVKP